MGSFPDRWMIGKSGDKFKPWIKIFMVPLALSGILCFMNVPLEGVALHAYVAFAYVLYGMSYTGTSMPFGAMASVVSTDPIRSKQAFPCKKYRWNFSRYGSSFLCSGYLL